MAVTKRLCGLLGVVVAAGILAPNARPSDPSNRDDGATRGVILAEEALVPLRVGQIIVIGNEWTYQAVIISQVTFFPGQEFCEENLRDTERNLYRLGIF